MSKYDLYRNTICKDNDNDYIILFKDEESAKIVFDEFNQKDQRIAELETEVKQLKANQNKVAIEKLEEVLKFIYGNKWTNIELCVDNSPLKIIRNKLDTMISGLKEINNMEQKELNAISDLFKSEYDKLLKEINDKLTFAYEKCR